MSSTFASRLTGSDGRDLRLALVVQGVPVVFQQGLTDLPDAVVALAGYGDGSQHTRFKGVGKIEQSAKELDLVQRRMVGGSMTVDVDDDAAGTLLALFSPRRRRAAFLIGKHNGGVDDFLDVSSTGAFDLAGGHVYVGGETLTYDSHDTVSRLTDVVGGAFGSEAQDHFGAADNGSGVFTTPPSWIGRRVKLIGYFDREDGTTTADLAMVLDTFRLEEAPRYLGQEKWQLQCSHLSDEFAKRKLGSGQREVHAFDFNDGDLTYTISDGADRFVMGGVTTWVRIRGASAASVTVDDVTRAPTVTRGRDTAMVTELVSATGLVIEVRGQNAVDGGLPVLRPTDLRHVAWLAGGNAGTLVCYALLSRVGDAANGAFDVLPGLVRSGFGANGWAFGAGIRDGEVDTGAFESVGAAAGQWSWVIDDEYDAAEMLRDFCIATDSFWFVNRNGQLSVKRLSEERAASVLTLDDDVIIGEPTVDFVEEDIAPRVSLTCNWDTVSEQFLHTTNLIDSDLADRYPDHHDRLEIESRGIVVATDSAGTHLRDAVTVAEIESRLRTMQKQGDRGRIRVTCVCHLDALIVDLGDVVTVTVDVPDLEGATIEGRTGRVLAIGPKTDEGTVDLTFELFEPLLAIAPAAVITATAGTTVTLEASKDGTTAPARMFAAGWSVEQRASDGQIIADFIIAAVLNDTQLQLDAAPVATLGSDFLCSGEQAFTNLSANTNDAGLALTDLTYQMPNSEADIVAGTTPGVANAESRWR